jgi:hypothetical protein
MRGCFETLHSYDGPICKLIMDNVKFEEEFKDMTMAQQNSHKMGLWAVWSTLVSKSLDSKRHNQKATLREVFWGECLCEMILLLSGFKSFQWLLTMWFVEDWFDSCDCIGDQFPTCEDLLRDNWYIPDLQPPEDMVNRNVPEHCQTPPAQLLGVDQLLGVSTNAFSDIVAFSIKEYSHTPY